MNHFDDLEKVQQTQGATAALDRLIDILRAEKQWHNLFDAMLLKKKYELGLPLIRPTSLKDVPENFRPQVEETYLQAAREVGTGFIGDGDPVSAWMYYKVIGDPTPVAEALDKMPDRISDPEQLDRLVHIALYQGVNPAKGLKWMINGQGLCSSITAMDQAMPSLTPPQRVECAKVLVRTIYDELRESVQRHVEQRIPMIPPNQTLDQLIAGRDWLFEGGTYHVDVSHLSAVVRFARSIEPPAEELELAVQLANYGMRLDPSLQYGGDPPFSDIYPAHLQFFNVLLDRNREAGLKYFRKQLDDEPDAEDKVIFAYVLVDLLVRSQRLDEAIQVAEEFLNHLGDEVNVSFDELCVQAGRLDVLKRVRRQQNNLVGFTSALVRETNPPTASSEESPSA